MWSIFAISSFFVVLWNIITVSLRQSLIPDRMLGRANSVYRFLGWGMIPVGAFLGGVKVAGAELVLGREWALRAPFIFAALVQAALFSYALPRLSSAKIDAAKARATCQASEPGARGEV
ncbi:MAG TPA: hypothetical protein VMS99_00020 [Acidimicrobiia bacterium]|nr:hypothetical protein [Acidimicrobiia bacterium]